MFTVELYGHADDARQRLDRTVVRPTALGVRVHDMAVLADRSDFRVTERTVDLLTECRVTSGRVRCFRALLVTTVATNVAPCRDASVLRGGRSYCSP